MSYQCNNFKCRKRIEGVCYITNCFHIFCQTCSQHSLSTCFVCSTPNPLMKSIELPVKKQGTNMKLIGMELKDIATSVYTALSFLKTQKEFEEKFQVARLAGYKRAFEDLKVKKELEKQKQKEIKQNCQKLIQDRHLLSSINQTSESDNLTQEILNNDFFDNPQ